MVHAAFAAAARFAANAGFINLDNLIRPAKRIVAVERAHVLPDFVAHAPCGFVGDANLALDALGGDTVPRSREQEHHVKPIAKAGPGPVEGRPGGRIQLIGAPIALLGAAAFDAAVFRRTPALGAIEVGSEPNLKQVIEAAILGRKAVLKLAECWSLCHVQSYNRSAYMFQGDNHRFKD